MARKTRPKFKSLRRLNRTAIIKVGSREFMGALRLEEPTEACCILIVQIVFSLTVSPKGRNKKIKVLELPVCWLFFYVVA